MYRRSKTRTVHDVPAQDSANHKWPVDESDERNLLPVRLSPHKMRISAVFRARTALRGPEVSLPVTAWR